ncbi:MAG: WYL domain-containing protein [Myxococcota bacterium]|nr:WYL domain-containing protein [Myxococcota bacterium]
MNRSERLFCLLDLLRTTSFMTAAEAAATLKVSKRTIYRDIRTLIQNGCDIRGEAGVGYRFEQSTQNAPLNLAPVEIEALLVGMRWLESWADEALLEATKGLIGKLQLEATQSTPILSAPRRENDCRSYIGLIRQRIQCGGQLRLQYVDAARKPTVRIIAPLGLFYWQSHWTVAAYCELRHDYRSFRLDRIQSMVVQNQSARRPGISLAEYLRRTALNNAESLRSQVKANRD